MEHILRKGFDLIEKTFLSKQRNGVKLLKNV